MRFRPTIPRRHVSTFIVLLIVCIAVGVAVDAYIASKRLVSTYSKFAEAETAYETAAYKPAAQSNPIRQEVGYLLSQVIQVPMSDTQRLDMARQGIAHLNDIEGQIDTIQIEGEHTAPLLAELSHASHNIGNIRKRAGIQEIMTLGTRNAQIIADIRGLSYRADYYTDEVFERVIDDQGKMTDAHKTYLNDLIPQLEIQFNQRENLYTELKKNADRMGELAKGLGISTR